MKYSNELMFVKAAYPDLFTQSPAGGVQACADVIEELEILLAGVKRLRRSYTTKILRGSLLGEPVAIYAQAGKDAMMQRFAQTLKTGVYVTRTGKAVGDDEPVMPRETIAPQKQEPSLSEPRLATQQEMDDMIAELSGLMPRAE